MRALFLTSLLISLVCALCPDAAKAQSRTPYQCAVRAVKALGEKRFPAFVQLVHPTKGITYRESGLGINEAPDTLVSKPFRRAALLGRQRFPITSAYDDSLLGQRISMRTHLLDILSIDAFHKTPDIRRNITNLDHSTDVFYPARPGETLISFHLTDPASELSWRALVVRTEVYQGNAYITGLEYCYWTP